MRQYLKYYTNIPRGDEKFGRGRCMRELVMLAHQPVQIREVSAVGAGLQLSGHTHGGQIWPFNYLVRIDQPVVQGLSRHGERTQLYTSRGTGFWGPPFRVFAPSEITLITLRRP